MNYITYIKPRHRKPRKTTTQKNILRCCILHSSKFLQPDSSARFKQAYRISSWGTWPIGDHDVISISVAQLAHGHTCERKQVKAWGGGDTTVFALVGVFDESLTLGSNSLAKLLSSLACGGCESLFMLPSECSLVFSPSWHFNYISHTTCLAYSLESLAKCSALDLNPGRFGHRDQKKTCRYPCECMHNRKVVCFKEKLPCLFFIQTIESMFYISLYIK